jgi:hypothetical protein
LRLSLARRRYGGEAQALAVVDEYGRHRYRDGGKQDSSNRQGKRKITEGLPQTILFEQRCFKGGVVHARKLRGRPDNACREAIERSVKISAPSGSHPLPGLLCLHPCRERHEEGSVTRGRSSPG